MNRTRAGLRLGVSFSLGRPASPRQVRWPIVGAAVVLTLAMCWCASFLSIAARASTRASEHRYSEGEAASASQANSGGVRSAFTFVRFRGRDVFVLSLDDDSPAALHPEAMARLPRPGSAVASPALLRVTGGPDGFTSRFGWKFDRRLKVHWARLIPTPEDWVVIVRVPTGRDLRGAPRIVDFDIGVSSSPARAYTIAEEAVAPTIGEAVWQGVWLVAVPAFAIALALLLRSAAEREGRVAILRRLGAGRFDRILVDVVQAMVLAGCPSVVVVIVWAVVAPMLDALPGTGLRIWRPDAAVHATWLVLVVLLVVGLVTAVLALSRSVPRRNRGRAGVPGISLLVPVGLLAAARVVDRNVGTVLFAVGIVVTAAAFASLLRPILPVVGALVAGRGGPASLIAGRRMQASPSEISRVVALAGVAAFSGMVALGFLSTASVRSTEPARPPGWPDGGSTLFRWQAAQPADLSRVSAILDGREVRAVAQVSARPGDPPRLVSHPDEDFGVLAPFASISTSGSVDRLHVLHVLRRAFGLADEVPAPSEALDYPPLRWISRLLIPGLAGLGVAAVVWVDGRRRVLPVADQRLLRCGATERTLASIARWQFLVPLVVSVAAGLTLGLLYCWGGVSLDLTLVPWARVATLVVGSFVLLTVPLEAASLWRRVAARSRTPRSRTGEG